MKIVKLKGPVVTAIIASLAMAGVVGAFMTNASPYVTIAEARHTGGDSLHLAGVLVKNSVQADIINRRVSFKLKDKDGQIIEVDHNGTQPASLLEADKIVAIGSIHGDKFVSHDLLVKCPSKYDEKKADPKLSS